jgi:hypothetical protein
MADDLQRQMEGVEDSVALTATTPASTTLIPPPSSVSCQFSVPRGLQLNYADLNSNRLVPPTRVVAALLDRVQPA